MTTTSNTSIKKKFSYTNRFLHIHLCFLRQPYDPFGIRSKISIIWNSHIYTTKKKKASWFLHSFPWWSPCWGCFLHCFAALDKTLFSSSHDCPFRVSFQSQWEFCISLAAQDISQSGLFPEHVLYGLEASLSWISSVLAVALVSQAFVLMAFWACALSLRWLRVMVTLKVCVCCSSILSSSDILMKGHQEKAWRKPARNLQKEDKLVFFSQV